jgi:quercetin dioxygenase-like cupin family protein
MRLLDFAGNAREEKLPAIALMQRGGWGLESRFSGEGCGDVVVAPGYLGRYLHSDQITQGRVDIAPGAVIPDHSHPHEQWTLLLSGSLELTGSGTAHLRQPGQVLYIAPHERHSARALTACVGVDVFHPPRDDYR